MNSAIISKQWLHILAAELDAICTSLKVENNQNWHFSSFLITHTYSPKELALRPSPSNTCCLACNLSSSGRCLRDKACQSVTIWCRMSQKGQHPGHAGTQRASGKYILSEERHMGFDCPNTGNWSAPAP